MDTPLAAGAPRNFSENFWAGICAQIPGFWNQCCPPASGVVLVFFSASTPPTLPFPGRKLAPKKYYFLDLFFLSELPKNKKNQLTNIPPRKKNGAGTQCCVTHRVYSVYSGKRFNTVSARIVERD